MILFLRELLGPLGHLFSRPHFMASVSLACTENAILEIIAQPYYALKTLKKMFLGLPSPHSAMIELGYVEGLQYCFIFLY